MIGEYIENPEPFLKTLAQLFAMDGCASEVAVLTYSKPKFVEVGWDNWNGGITSYGLIFNVSISIYTQIQEGRENLEKSIFEKICTTFPSDGHNSLASVSIVPEVKDDPKWRENAIAWLNGDKVNNQGRVRSTNIAPLSEDGLLFRSRPEIHLYKALKSKGISFAPLPVFVRGGENYRRIEPDFFIVHQGIAMVVEVDGDTVHRELPAEAQARTNLLQHEGVFVERVLASKCDSTEKAMQTAEYLVDVIAKHKRART